MVLKLKAMDFSLTTLANDGEKNYQNKQNYLICIQMYISRVFGFICIQNEILLKYFMLGSLNSGI